MITQQWMQIQSVLVRFMYTDDLLANAESIIGHTLDSYTTKYDGLINSLQECYDTVRSNRSELEVPSDDGYYDENGQGDLR